MMELYQYAICNDLEIADSWKRAEWFVKTYSKLISTKSLKWSHGPYEHFHQAGFQKTVRNGPAKPKSQKSASVRKEFLA
jgi:hypothetical protein